MHRYLTGLVAVASAVGLATSAMAKEPPAFSARAGVGVARDAAMTWAPDARLVYVENDEGVDAAGTSPRWGYLYYSAAKGRARGYSVRDGRIYEASDLGFDLDAPQLCEDWVDSEVAFTAAEKKAGAEFRRESAGTLSTMLLIRGAFDDKKPDATTWALVYTSDTQPSLFVVVDARQGKVIRTWRG